MRRLRGLSDPIAPMSDSTFKTIDFEKFPKHFDAVEAEKKWDDAWQTSGVYHWNPDRPREETFVVDTPPPTVSGSLHIGHVFSYTQTDVTVRYRRMRGMNIFYPMGWDDNGLPTERRVQNYYHVRCDPTLAYEEGMTFEPASAKVRKKAPRLISRQNFIEACDLLTKEDEKAFLDLWRRVGVSVDWRQEYATVNEHCRKVAQLSFLDLHGKGHVYQTEAPTMWDVDFQSAVAQAEVVEKNLPGAFHDIAFGIEGSDEHFTIATTRPELLGACVGVTAHPEDERYKHLFGKKAITPLFRAPVPIFPSDIADPEKGTGIVMVCTFGDQNDILWWRKENLALRQIVSRAGRLAEVTYGTDAFPSLDADAANRFYGELQGKKLPQARERIVELLQDPEGAATAAAGNATGAPLQGTPRKIEHPIKFFEKGDRPLELLPTRQWFCNLTEKKDALLSKGQEIGWHPGFMHNRFSDWTENLSIDWCLSRQRYFGVPIPVWYPLDADGNPEFDKAILPKAEILPVDPMTHVPEGYTADQRNQPGGLYRRSRCV